MSKTPEDFQSKLAQIAALRRWARTGVEDRRTHTDAARAALNARFEREADPEGSLDPEERSRRAAALRKAWFIELGLRSHGYVPKADALEAKARGQVADDE